MRLPAIAACLFAAATALASEAQDVLVWVPGHWGTGAKGEQRWVDGYYVRGLVVDPPPPVAAPQPAAAPAPAPAAAPAPQVVHHYHDRPVWTPSIAYGFSIAPGYGHYYPRHRSRFFFSLGFHHGWPYW